MSKLFVVHIKDNTTEGPKLFQTEHYFNTLMEASDFCRLITEQGFEYWITEEE